MLGSEANPARPASPESPTASTSGHAPSTIDELTVALANYSRLPEPAPEYQPNCCCGKEDCANTKSWIDFKSQLENRLILSAEVGQALLQKHDSYVRQHEACHNSSTPRSSQLWDSDTFTNQLSGLYREKAMLEKRLNQALINAEVAEASTKTAQQELQDARSTITRLTTQHTRSLGWDTRLSAALKEKDDIQQERDSEAQRARLAESRIQALRQRMAKLQQEVRHLQEDLEQRRMHRLESSEHLLQDARARIDSLQATLGHTARIEHAELTNMLESLIDDNEGLKRDNAELQAMLSSAREDINQLQTELEEQRASRSYSPRESFLHHRTTGSVPITSSMGAARRPKRNASLEQRNRQPLQLLTPETTQRPLSPADLYASEARYAGSSKSHAASLDLNFGPESYAENSRSRGVQTDSWHAFLSPSPLPSHISSPAPLDLGSEASSVSESQAGYVSALVERVATLLNSLAQADAVTLTNRLKRQHLRGADVGHLSRSTISGILNEVANLRLQFRGVMEDEKAVTACTRKDFRALFKVFKDMFAEMGAMRVTLNEVILDPTVAVNIRDHAMNPTKGETEKDRDRVADNLGGWIAPLSKLFGAPGSGSDTSSPNRGASPLTKGLGQPSTRPAPKVIPKLRPALSASTTTVNVEFSGAGVGRSVTTTFSAHTTVRGDPVASTSASAQSGSSSLMGIFAGAPRAPSAPADPWVVVPKAPRRMKSTNLLADATISRSRGVGQRFPRDVDAVVDGNPQARDGDEEADYVPPLLERTLRRRGLSDSSIHSTFLSHQDDASPTIHDEPEAEPAVAQPYSMLQALGRRIPSLNLAASLTGSARSSPSRPQARMQTTPSPGPPRNGPSAARTVSPAFSRILPSLPAWVDGEMGVESPEIFQGSYREQSLLNRRHLPG
ncbi:hypothetical protein HGRIS_009280 [Hohenbuehelia grisea]|uniref:Uncharacterized protein n=1 Tax=Hohenbuehelia grisea TaxID=104357 RepID=A0ABR3J139_9AGAR